MRFTNAVIGLLMLPALAGCSDYGSSTEGGGGGRSATIIVGNDFFSPTPDTVLAGQVTFSWATPSNGHNLTWDRGPGTLPPNSGVLTSGTQVVTLQSGTYDYHCAIHGGPGSGMHGKIVVQ